jgi:hypothetical protein
MLTRASNSSSKKKELIVSGLAKRTLVVSTAIRELPRVTLLATLGKANTARPNNNRQNHVTDCKVAPVMPQIQTV